MLMQVDRLNAGYGSKRIINDITLSVGVGEIVAVLGHNAAGKSTLMKAIAGVIRPESGMITFRDRAVTGRKPSENVRDGMGYAPQGARVFRSLTVYENLLLGGF